MVIPNIKLGPDLGAGRDLLVMSQPSDIDRVCASRMRHTLLICKIDRNKTAQCGTDPGDDR